MIMLPVADEYVEEVKLDWKGLTIRRGPKTFPLGTALLRFRTVGDMPIIPIAIRQLTIVEFSLNMWQP